jgi:hypothetical protein
MKYMFQLDGMQSMSHWQGVGVSGTEWDAVFTGYGTTRWNAANDAVDMLCQSRTISPDTLGALDAEAGDFDDDVLTCESCGAIAADECDGSDEECDNAWIVNLYVRW